jgi:hypothetical protein
MPQSLARRRAQTSHQAPPGDRWRIDTAAVVNSVRCCNSRSGHTRIGELEVRCLARHCQTAACRMRASAPTVAKDSTTFYVWSATMRPAALPVAKTRDHNVYTTRTECTPSNPDGSQPIPNLVVEIANYVPTSTEDRNAAIADLLTFAGLPIKSDAVNSILTTRKRFRGGDSLAAAWVTFARLPTQPSSNSGTKKRPRY